MEQNVRDNNLTTKELTAIADYVRTSFKNKSLYEFFTKDLGVKANFGKNGYMVVSDKISVSKTRNEGLLAGKTARSLFCFCLDRCCHR